MSVAPAVRVETRERRPRRKTAVLVAATALLLVVILAVVSYIRVQDRRRAAELARTVMEALEARRLDEAGERVERWAARRPRDIEPDYLRARLAVERNDSASALAAIRRAHLRGYPEAPLTVLSAVLQARAGQYEAAEPVLRRALASSTAPRAAIAEGLTRIYLGTFRLTEAARTVDQWMEASPGDARPYLCRNEIDDRVGADPQVIIRNNREALRRDPSLAPARLRLAETLQKLHRDDEASAEYAILLTGNPRNLAGLVGAGEVALVNGDASEAARLFSKALAIDAKQPSALRGLAAIDLKSGRFAEARDHLKAAVDAAPDDVETRYLYANALKTAGDDARASEERVAAERLRKERQTIDELRQALIKSPADANLRYEAAKWLIEHGHEREGLEWTDLILRQKPGHPQTCRFLADYYTKKENHGLANYYRLFASP
jgi:tetratricopeptide (TPR) repeat protein